MKTILPILLLIIGCVSTSFEKEEDINPHVFKSDLEYNKIIENPYRWTLIQLADGSISNPSPYAKIILKDGLLEMGLDIDNDNIKELFLAHNTYGRVKAILVFKRIDNYYKYIGSIGACLDSVINIKTNILKVYVACGGHNGNNITYYNNGRRFIRVKESKDLSVGDGGSDNNKVIFNANIQWIKVDKNKYIK